MDTFIELAKVAETKNIAVDDLLEPFDLDAMVSRLPHLLYDVKTNKFYLLIIKPSLSSNMWNITYESKEGDKLFHISSAKFREAIRRMVAKIIEFKIHQKD